MNSGASAERSLGHNGARQWTLNTATESTNLPGRFVGSWMTICCRKTGAGTSRPPKAGHPAFIEDLKAHARKLGLWNLFLPSLQPDEPGTRLSNLEYAPLAEIMGRLPSGIGGLRLQRSRHRQHGAAAPFRKSDATGNVAHSAAQR